MGKQTEATAPTPGIVLEPLKVAVGDGSQVSAVLARPAAGNPQAAIILAHGAGNDMTSPFMCAMHERLAARGFLTVKFNFPYKERGGKAPDPSRTLQACYRAVLDAVRHHLAPGLPVVIGGKSMGGRMASHLAAEGAAIDGLLLLGYPLHPAGRPEQLRTTHLEQITVPMLFFAGTRDPLCQLGLLRTALASMETHHPGLATLHIIDGGDHSFAVLKSLRRSKEEVMDEFASVSALWVQAVVSRR